MRFAIISTLVLSMTATCFAGDLTTRFQLTLDRVVSGGPPHFTKEFILADAVPDHRRRFTEFSGDVSGRYIEALSVVAASTSQTFPLLDEVVREALKLQKPDGHWGDAFTTGIANSDMALLWGNGRFLVGLMAYYRLKPDEDVLKAATRLGDCFIGMAPRLNSDTVQKQFSDARVAVGYICWTQIIEGTVELARVTKEPRFLELAKQLSARTEMYPSQHSHGFVTTLRGIVDLYRLTGNRKYLAQVEEQWKAMMDSGNVLPHGAVPEAFKPSIKRDEGCAEADWLRLNLELWKLTRNTRYIEQTELTLFNEFTFNQFGSGDFGHHSITEKGTGPTSARAWWCCTFHGLRAFPDVFASALHLDEKQLCLDLPVDADLRTGELRGRVMSRLEKNGEVDIEISHAGSSDVRFAVRIPAWASDVKIVRAEPSTVPVVNDGTYVGFGEDIRTGDRFTIRYEFKDRVERDSKGKLSLFYGPWMLAVDDQASPHFFDEPHQLNRVPEGADGAPDISMETTPELSARRFSVPVAHRKLPFMPGGYPMHPQSAVLRPLAEKTGSNDQSRWEFLFTTTKSQP